MMSKNMLLVVVISLFSLFLFWTPFILKINSFWGIDFQGRGMEAIVQNFDGLNFLVVAKSLYNPVLIEQINTQFETGNTPIYFSAHFPLYALLVRALSYALPLPQALLLMIVLANVLLTAGLYYFFSTIFKNERMALLLTIIALFFPARMLSVRAVGSNEPLFIALIMTSLALSLRKKHYLAAIAGSLAVITRSPGILLFAGYFVSFLLTSHDSWKERLRSFLPYLLMPLTLLMLFGFYGIRYGSIMAYFQSGDNLHLFFPPFQIFSNMQSWISEMWREDIIYLYTLYGIGLSLYSKKFKNSVVTIYGIIYGLVLTLVAHRDLARYALPLFPIVLGGYSEMIEKIPPKYLYLATIMLIPIYLLGWQFILSNIQPINDWRVFL